MYWEDIVSYIAVAILIVALILAGIGNYINTEKHNNECIKNGGTIIKTYKQDICITKENIKAIKEID